jgi:hypothetical protein
LGYGLYYLPKPPYFSTKQVPKNAGTIFFCSEDRFGFSKRAQKTAYEAFGNFFIKKKMPPATRKKGVVSSRFRKNAGIRNIFV